MKHANIGIIAHVDSGKTTLSEALLYHFGAIRNKGRIDDKSTFLDTESLEKDRGITIFSKPCIITAGDMQITLMDTPGHTDFGAETGRVLSVLDAAIFVISAPEGIRSHTKFLWNLLKKNGIPTFIFINKTDLICPEKSELLNSLRKNLDEKCFEFSSLENKKHFEEIALCSPSLMDEYLEKSDICEKSIKDAIKQRDLFPCVFGSALKGEGVSDIANTILKYISIPEYKEEFGARVFKVTQNANQRLCHIKITGGTLRVRDTIAQKLDDGSFVTEKISKIHIFSGSKATYPEEVCAGQICAVSGLSYAKSGDGLGFEQNLSIDFSDTQFSHKVVFDKNLDAKSVYDILKKIQFDFPELDPKLENQNNITVSLKGDLMGEIVKSLALEKYALKIDFEKQETQYFETITKKSSGFCHFEENGAFAQIHLEIEPCEKDSGICVESNLSEDFIPSAFQKTILSYLGGTQFYGTHGHPLTDIKITLTGGKTHKKCTPYHLYEAASRALLVCVLDARDCCEILESALVCEIECDVFDFGKVTSDLEKLSAQIISTSTDGNRMTISALLCDTAFFEYSKKVSSAGTDIYMSPLKKTLIPSKNQETYDKTDFHYVFPSSSRFFVSGKVLDIEYDKAKDFMKLNNIEFFDADTISKKQEVQVRAKHFVEKAVLDEELLQIFEKTYGKIKKRKSQDTKYNPSCAVPNQKHSQKKATPKIYNSEYLLVDGYNIIFAWDSLKKLASQSLDAARENLINRLCSYKAFKDINIILVFDAYKVKENPGSVETRTNISVVYTKEAQTADAYIESVSKKLSKDNLVKVATSDGDEQMIILGSGALRITATELEREILTSEKAIREYIESL